MCVLNCSFFCLSAWTVPKNFKMTSGNLPGPTLEGSPLPISVWPGRAQGAPRRAQEAPKRPPEGPKRPPRDAQKPPGHKLTGLLAN